LRIAWAGSNALLAKIFPDSSTERRTSSFMIRAHSYNPLIRFLLRATIAVLVMMLVLQGWGVDAFGWLLNNTISRALLSMVFSVVITVAIAIVLWEYTNFRLERRVDKLSASGRTRQAARLRTLTPMLRAGFGAILVVVTLIICLSHIGVNTTGLLAVSSVVGIAVGFGSQKLVQDVITGLFLLFEDAMQVGDVVSLAGMSGTVERLSIRTIRLRGGDGSVNIIPFSSVTTVTNQTRDFSYAQISIMVGYHEDIDHVTAVLKEIGAKMREEAAWSTMMRDDLQLYGLDSFDEMGLVCTGQIRTGPGQHWAVRREFYGRVQRRFAEEGIELSHRQQTFRLDLPPGETVQAQQKLPPG
jgi:small conductance mechanosensitive channel